MRRLLPDFSGLPRTFWFLWAGIVVNRTTGFIVPYLAIWLTARGHSAAAAGAVAALYGAGAIAGSLAGGVVADRIGRRFALLFGLSGSAAAVAALAFAPFSLLPALVLAAGFFGEAYRPPSQAAVADLVPPADRDRAFGLVYWGVNMGFAVGGAVAGLLASVSTPLLFVADAVTTLAFALLVFVRVPETRPPGLVPSGHPVGDALRGLAATFGDRHLAAFLGLSFLGFLVFMQLHVALPLDLTAKGFGPATLGALYTVNGILIGAVQPFAARWLRRFDRGRVIAAALALVGLGFLLHGPAASAPAFAVAVAIWSIGEIAWLPPASTVVADLAPLALRGRYQGAYSTSISVATFVSPLFGPALHARFGSVPFWSAGLVVCLACAAGHLAIAGPRRRHLDALPRARA